MRQLLVPMLEGESNRRLKQPKWLVLRLGTTVQGAGEAVVPRDERWYLKERMLIPFSA
jgi:hypothetical protein